MLARVTAAGRWIYNHLGDPRTKNTVIFVLLLLSAFGTYAKAQATPPLNKAQVAKVEQQYQRNSDDERQSYLDDLARLRGMRGQNCRRSRCCQRSRFTRASQPRRRS
jgi:hypothetical protein